MAAERSTPLDIAIIGAGIAGLGACIALKRAGHHVELFEKSRFRSEIGAAMSVTPNGNLVLKHWGFDFAKAQETEKVQNRRLAFDTLEKLAGTDYSFVPEKYGNHFNAFHRVDMHSELRRLAEDSSLPGSADFKLGADVKSIDCEAGSLTFQDGSTIHKDLIIVADGIKSRFVEAINGKDIPRNFTGMSVHRTLIDMDALMANDIVRPVYEGQESGFVYTIDPSTGIMFMTYPCRADKVMNTAIFHRAKPTEKSGDDWNAPADIADVMSLLQGFHPFWKEIANCADAGEWKCFPVSKRDPLERITRGKAVTIGDAAHACLPTHAQGGAMAIEDAAALGVMFTGATKDDVEQRLQVYEQLRLPRSATTQLLSNAMMYNRSGSETVNHIRQYYTGELPIGSEMFAPQVCDFFFGYDILKQSEIALKHLEAPDSDLKNSMQYFGTIDPVGA